jgi:hypothetical protein
MITISQPALALHSCDVKGFLYQMRTTWYLPSGATAQNVVNWIGFAVDHAPELELRNVVINSHGGAGKIFIGGRPNPPITIKDVGLFSQLRAKDIGTLWIVGCEVAMGSSGLQFCTQLATVLGCDVVAADDDQFVEGRYDRGNTPFGTIDDFEGTAYRFSPSGSKALFSIHDPQAETELYQ